MSHSENFYYPHSFYAWISPEEAFEQDVNGTTLKEFKRRARKVNSECEVCGRPIWRMVDLGMCFTCVTGESDASDDYELAPEI